MTTNELNSRIEQLAYEAGCAGDTEMVRICERALAGSARALGECVRVIEATEAEDEE